MPLFLVGFDLASQTEGRFSFDIEKEKAAIKETVNNETNCFWQADYDCWEKTWSHTQASSIIYRDGLYETHSWESLSENNKNMFKDWDKIEGKIAREDHDNFNYYFMGELNVVVWFDAFLYEVTGNCIYAKCSRVLEKQGDYWRIVFATGIVDPKKPCQR